MDEAVHFTGVQLLVCTCTFFVGLISGWLMGFLDDKDAERRDAWNRRNVVG